MIKEILKEKKTLVDAALASLLAGAGAADENLLSSMNYSLLAGGKRVRPALFLMALEIFGKKAEDYLSAACALECVHTYSLIHDDLPQMDNDDYRRGRLTNHKVYGAGMATMAGDGLLTYAFELLAKMEDVSAETRVALIRILAEASGPAGMVGGQALDIEAEKKKLTISELRRLDRCKTGCLLTAPLDMAAVIADAPADIAAALHAYGLHIGQLFQITDDLLDAEGSLETMGKLPGQDALMGKSTYISLLGIEGARKAAEEEATAAKEIAEALGEEGKIFAQLADFLLLRKK